MAVGLVKDLRKISREYLKERGAVFRDGLVLIPYICPQLKEIGVYNPIKGDPIGPFDPKTVCMIHDHKPALCKAFHGKRTTLGFPTYVPKECTMKE